MRTILSLCDFSGNWSKPYRDAGYDVRQVDIAHGGDVRLMRHIVEPVHGILAAPPCTHFARSGALHWKRKGDAAILEGLSIVDACLRMVALYSPEWWALENPIGRLKDYLGDPAFKFDPCDYGDPYTKRTWLWGRFAPPLSLMPSTPCAVEPLLGDRTTAIAAGRRRSTTPLGFAIAFFEANP